MNDLDEGPMSQEMRIMRECIYDAETDPNSEHTLRCILESIAKTGPRHAVIAACRAAWKTGLEDQRNAGSK